MDHVVEEDCSNLQQRPNHFLFTREGVGQSHQCNYFCPQFCQWSFTSWTVSYKHVAKTKLPQNLGTHWPDVSQRHVLGIFFCAWALNLSRHASLNCPPSTFRELFMILSLHCVSTLLALEALSLKPACPQAADETRSACSGVKESRLGDGNSEYKPVSIDSFSLREKTFKGRRKTLIENHLVFPAPTA